MPRTARQLADDAIYHVMNRGSMRRKIFYDHDDYVNFLDLLASAKQRYQVRLYAYCLMPNHYHLLLQASCGTDLGHCMHWLQTSYARRYQHKYERCGRVWQGRYRSELIEDDEHLLTVHRYIEGNPLRANLATTSLAYPWSSHRVHALSGGGVDVHSQVPGLDRLPIEVPKDWTAYVDAALSAAEIEKVRKGKSLKSSARGTSS